MTAIQQNSQVKGPQEQIIKNTPTSPIDSDSSDSLYDFVKDVNQKSYLKRTIEEDQELVSKYKGKHGLKYQKISNEQRQQLIKLITTTGCMIKHAARDLNINFSTAKAIMQIFRREGRMSKKKKRATTQSQFKNPEIQIQDAKECLIGQFGLAKEEQCQQRLNNVQDNLDTIHFQQMEEKNRNQAIFIQQLKTQVRNFKQILEFLFIRESKLIITGDIIIELKLFLFANSVQSTAINSIKVYQFIQVRYAMPQYQQQFQF